MSKIFSRAVILLMCAARLTQANTHNSSTTHIEVGTFQNPSALLRPRFRYWVPDPSVDEATELEALNIYLGITLGGELGGPAPGADWVKWGFGTPDSNKLFVAALQAHRDAGLKMNFSIGPDQGQGVPAKSDDEGLQWDLVPSVATVAANGSFTGIIPGWSTGELVALISAEVISSRDIANATSPSSPKGNVLASWTQLVVKQNSLTDWTTKVSSNGYVSLVFPPAATPLYRLFAFYQKRTHTKNIKFASNTTDTIFDNGSYRVDHFSARGAQTVIDFWEKHILSDEVKSLLTQVGNYAWEDSVELRSNMSWTPSLPTIFKEKYGYSLKKYLPLVMFANNNIGLQTSMPGKVQCLLNTPDQGVGYINDFRGALVEGNRRYLVALNTWVNSVLKLQFSTQVGYNLPVDMEALIPLVDAPECESLGFGDNIDGYRQYTGPAVLSGKRVISNEMGALSLETYRYNVSSLLWSINRAVAGGVNQFVIHGQSYTGNYYGTTWPGHNSFSYFYSEMWSNKQPVWDNGFSDFINYVGRLQYSQQTGILVTDVAVYDKQSGTDFTLRHNSANFDDLVKSGYSFNYLSPENLELRQAYVKKSILAPDGPAYKAFVIPSTTNVTLDSISKVQKLAEAGLPVILSDGDPYQYITTKEADRTKFTRALASLKSTRNVYSVPKGQIAEKLATLRLDPQIRVQANGTWYTTWRKPIKGRTQFAWVFNDGGVSTGQIEVSCKKTPYFFDLWTGNIRPVLEYRESNGKIVIPLSLQANQTVLIGFSDEKPDGSPKPLLHAQQVPSTVVGYEYKANGRVLELHVASGRTDKPLTLSSGKEYTALPSLKPAPSFLLSNWSLIAEHWVSPNNISDASPIAAKYNTTHELPSLVSWMDIPALVNVSGLGYYSTGFDWSLSSSSSLGAYIVFPQVLQGLRVLINGQRLPPLDYNAPRANIGPFLKEGRNEVMAVVPTTMWNYIRSIFDHILMAGYPPLITIVSPGLLPSIVDNGLMGTVQIMPYVKVEIEA